MPEPASRMRRRPLRSSAISIHGVLQPCSIDAAVAQGTEPRTPQNRTRMRTELITASRNLQSRALWFLERAGGSNRTSGRCVQRSGSANERLQRLFINLVALMKIDGAPGVAVEAGVEQT